MEPLREGVMTPGEFLEKLGRSDEPTAGDLADLMGRIFALGDPTVYLIEVNGDFDDAAAEYLQVVMRELGLLGALVPKDMFDIVGAVRDER